MTRKGALVIIDTLALRIFELQERRDRINKEESELRARILELEKVTDDPEIVPSQIVVVT
jgi:hypothetical protein